MKAMINSHKKKSIIAGIVCSLFAIILISISIGDVLKMGVHEYLDSLQIRLNEIGGEISSTFFKVLPVDDQNIPQQ